MEDFTFCGLLDPCGSSLFIRCCSSLCRRSSQLSGKRQGS